MELSMSPVDAYRANLSQIIDKQTLKEENWKFPEWKQAWEGLDQTNGQAILNDAFNQQTLARSLFSNLGTILSRQCKFFSRIEKKKTEQIPGKENYFKVVCDFIGMRVPCKVTEIKEKIDKIRETVLTEKGQIHIRGSTDQRPYGFHIGTDKQYADITQYVYVFIKTVGYPIEFQIGEEFASHTFTIDSALRDPQCRQVDLWQDGFYEKVKQHILDKANRKTVATTKEDILNQANRLHQNRMPEELGKILSKL